MEFILCKQNLKASGKTEWLMVGDTQLFLSHFPSKVGLLLHYSHNETFVIIHL